MLTDAQKKMLTEFLGECWHGELSDDECLCGKIFFGKRYKRIFKNHIRKYARTFLTWDDLGDCKYKLVEKGLWAGFWEYTRLEWIKEYRHKYPELPPHDTRASCSFGNWLFRPVDENGEPHFCRLVCSYLETIK